jgi:hypothetical protein
MNNHKKKCDKCNLLKVDCIKRNRIKTIEKGQYITQWCKAVWLCKDCISDLDKLKGELNGNL